MKEEKNNHHIEFFHTIEHQYLQHLAEVKAIIKEKTVTHMTEEEKMKVIFFLNELEHYCTGVNLGVYDIGVTNRLCGTFLIRMYPKFVNFIEEYRSEKQSKTLYGELEGVVQKIKKLRPLDIHENKEKIAHS